MSLKYNQRSLIVLSLLGILSAIMSVLSVILIFQLQSLQAAVKESPPSTSAVIPAHVWAVLLPVSAVLSALALTLHLSSVVVCLLHSYFSTELCRGEQDTDRYFSLHSIYHHRKSDDTVGRFSPCCSFKYFINIVPLLLVAFKGLIAPVVAVALQLIVILTRRYRADWFLLDSRAVRHVAIGLFCLGVSVYLAALSIFMLLIFEVETGIASASILSSGIVILLIVVVHSLVKASQSTKHCNSDRLDTFYQNDHGGSNPPISRTCELKIGVDKPRMHRSQSHVQRPISYPHCGNPRQREQQQQYSHAGGSQGPASDKEGYSIGGSCSRMHRTLSTESGLLQAQAKPWNGVNNEMRSVLARKSGISAKDSTLV